MKAKIIAFMNLKGGVGKTSFVVNIATILASKYGKKVLVVDLDPQCNSTFWLLNYKEWGKNFSNKTKSTYQIFADRIHRTHDFVFEESVVKGVPRNGELLVPMLDVLPASTDLIKVEDKQPESFKYIYQAIQPHCHQYDYIFLDCAPNFYTVTKNALLAADYCVVPYLPDFLSFSGFNFLAQEIRDFCDRFSSSFQDRKKPTIAAILISHYRRNSIIQEETLGDLDRQMILLREERLIHPRCERLEPKIRFTVDIADSTNAQLPISLFKSDSIATEDYEELSHNFLKHFEEVL